MCVLQHGLKPLPATSHPAAPLPEEGIWLSVLFYRYGLRKRTDGRAVNYYIYFIKTLNMTLSQFVSKLNWRLMLVHLIACWFFIYASMELAALYDINIFKELKDIRSNAVQRRIFYDAIWVSLGEDAGVLTAFIISLVLSIKHRWYWLNSVIVLLVGFFLNRFDLFGWQFLKHIFLKPGLLFKSYIGYYLTNGLIMLTIGLLLFFLKWSVRFINGERLSALSKSVPA